MRFLYQRDELVAGYVASLVPHCRRGFGANIKTIGVVDDTIGQLVAGLVYHNYDPEAAIIEISGAAIDPRWLTRAVLRRMFDFPFTECACQMVIMRVRRDNERLLRMLMAYGFDLIPVPRLFGSDSHGVLCTLTDDQWSSNKFNRRDKMKEEAA
jgi:RimJ/RimL family protein N-acetyltransferase